MQLASRTEATSDLIADRQPFSRNPVRDCDQHTPHQGHGGLDGGGCFVSTVLPTYRWRKPVAKIWARFRLCAAQAFGQVLYGLQK